MSTVTKAGQIPAYSFVPSNAKNYEPPTYTWKNDSRENRIAEARRLYAAAGYSVERPLQIVLLYNTHESLKNINLAVASMWREALGVKSVLVNEELKVFLETRKDKSRWDMIRLAWSVSYNDAYPFLQIFMSSHAANDVGYRNLDYDALVRQAEIELDLVRHREYLEEAEQLLLEQYAIIPVYFYVSKHLIKPHVNGHHPSATNYHPSKNYRIEH